jgi:hypothetical protein
VFAFERDRSEGGRTFVFTIGFWNPVDDAGIDVKDRDQVWLAADGIVVSHSGRARVEIEPTDGLAGLVVFDRLDPGFPF